ncbi:aminoacetone oxidase family FAD-binding enzyme [Putridiphycobacter roseus]|uniref:Aminoacetone oxidase family FAD-binding enzyme n=1 Tax=Putridiphycobacter roseus TaxID=2219161 RepID=A0A2W1NP99_9FLAO|nr:NAD(P)-dependent oxidoreductase [Putridiphycobacter roseus]PZE17462.1 aminoacetone oxidase family FAD-binding enzyme [Putridiphycobacter roseus]
MKAKIAIIGGGASALFFATQIDTQKFEVQIFEQKKTLGRKLLVAGNGGFNLTHSSPVNQLVKKYIPVEFLSDKLEQYDNLFFQHYLKELHIPTFIGSSKRVFPVPPIKPIEVLNELLKVIKEKDITIASAHKWQGWNADYTKLLFKTENDQKEVAFDMAVFCMGGNSWQKTGSNGHWLNIFQKAGITCHPFQSSNCEMLIDWSHSNIGLFAGTPLKNIAVKSSQQQVKGELVVTKNGMEGNAIYALSNDVRTSLNTNGTALVYLDLKPGITIDKIIEKLAGFKNGNWTAHVKQQLKLTKVALELIRFNSDKFTYTDPDQLAHLIKNIPLKIYALGPIDAAISTVGGVALQSVNAHFELQQLPNQFVIGEMLDWDAPTGGYLLQGCFTMGTYLANYFNNKTVP